MSNKKLKELTDKWYARLKEEGFNDIEDTNSPKQMLKKWDTHIFKNRIRRKYKDITNIDYQPESFLATERYYQIAEHFLNTHKFSDPSHKFIWKLHSEGTGVRHIADSANKRYKKTFNKDIVNTIIQTLAATMLKEYNDSDDQ